MLVVHFLPEICGSVWASSEPEYRVLTGKA